MKILMINKYFYKKGGSENYMFALSDLLKKNGHQVIDFSMQHEKNKKSDYSQFFIKNISFTKRQGIISDIKKAFHLLYSFEAKRNLEKLILQEKPDIAHLHNFSFQLTPSILSVLKKHNIPVVWTMHDYKFICPNYRLFTMGAVCERCRGHKYYNCLIYKCFKNNLLMSKLAMKEMYLHKLILKSYKAIGLFISPSRFLMNKVKQFEPKTKVKHVYNFIDFKDLKPSEDIGQGLIYFGRLSEEKGLISLLEAMKKIPKINLNIVGNGPQKAELEQFIKENKLKNVKLLGYKKGLELYDLIRNSRLVITPSIWYENNPISILEAFALKKPVIGADLGGIPELVKDNKTGLLYRAGDDKDLADKIKKAYFDLKLAEKLGNNAMNWVKNNCNSQNHYKEILQIYKNMV